MFLCVKGISGSQLSHNNSPGLQLFTQGVSPPTPVSSRAPRLRSPPPPSGNRRNQLYKTAPRETDTQISQRPGPRGLRLDWGRGNRRKDRRREILLPRALPSPFPQRRALWSGQTSRPRLQEEGEGGGGQHSMNYTRAAGAPRPSCTPVFNQV